MAHKALEIKARDGAAIPCGVWDAQGDIILYMHGIESHMGWFADMAARFQDRGLAVYAFDRRGSGLSKEERGHIDSYKILLDDIIDIINGVKKARPGAKLYLMGVCGGGRFAADFAAYDPRAIDGLILVSPAIRTKVTLSLMGKLDVLVNSFLNPKKKIHTPLRDDMFTKNKRFVDFIRQDTLSLHHLTARFYRELIMMDVALAKRVFSLDIPILTLLAGDDEIVDNDAMAGWHGRLKARDKELKQFPGTCHFLPFEEDVDEIVDYITRWIGARGRRS